MSRVYEQAVTDSGLPVYTFPALDEMGFLNFFTTRHGGASQPPYASLNTSYDVGDMAACVDENIGRIKSALGIKDLWLGAQVHGNDVSIIDALPLRAPEEADAVAVIIPQVAVAVRSADCAPILLADPARKVAVAIHAGRRGAQLHIAEKVVGLLVERFGCKPSDMVSAIGPAICPSCYQVDRQTAENFQRYTACGNGRYLDIVGASVRQMESAGVPRRSILDCGVCTACNKDEFFSYRADGKLTGRFITGISVK